MLTEIYIEALLVDQELADQVWEAWYAGETNDATAYIACRSTTMRSVGLGRRDISAVIMIPCSGSIDGRLIFEFLI